MIIASHCQIYLRFNFLIVAFGTQVVANKIQFIADISLEKCKLCLPSREITETAQYLLAHKETARNENSSCGIVFVVLEQ